MYNENVKMAYVNYSDNSGIGKPTVEFIQRLFNQISEYEDLINKDCCNFTIYEIISYYKSLCSNSLEYLMNVNSQFKKYTDWCLVNQNMINDNQNHYREIDNEILIKCINTTLSDMRIVSRNNLLKSLNEILNPNEQFVILGIFEGIGGKNFQEFYDITKDCFTENSIKLNTGREIKISKKLIDIGLESIDSYQYSTYSSQNNGEYRIMEFDKSDNTVIKAPERKNPIVADSNNPQLQHQRIYSKVIRIRKLTGNQIFTPSTLVISGLINKIKEVMKEKNIGIKEALKDPEIIYIYGKTDVKRFITKYGKHIEEGGI